MPKVSVIVPVYGVENYIERCVRSLFEQALDDIEYLFIDDCSPDESIEILNHVLEEYPQRKPQVIIHRMEKNSGQAAVRAWGMQNATGDFIIHCDSDDWVERNMYSLMYEKAVQKDADVVMCDYAICDGSNQRIQKCCFATDKKSIIQDMCSMRITWSVWNKLIKKSLLEKNIVYPKDNMGEDMALTLQIVLSAQRFEYVPKPLYYYYNNPKSITKVNTINSIISKYHQHKKNVEIVLSAFHDFRVEYEYLDSLMVIKWNAKKLLWGLVHYETYFKLWKETYSEINGCLLSNPQIIWADKLRFGLTYLRLYPRKKNRIYE